jgi:hypothetical protein
VCATEFAEWFVICVQHEFPRYQVMLEVRHSVDGCLHFCDKR